jgi:hypothetical protein
MTKASKEETPAKTKEKATPIAVKGMAAKILMNLLCNKKGCSKKYYIANHGIGFK